MKTSLHDTIREAKLSATLTAELLFAADTGTRPVVEKLLEKIRSSDEEIEELQKEINTVPRCNNCAVSLEDTIERQQHQLESLNAKNDELQDELNRLYDENNSAVFYATGDKIDRASEWLTMEKAVDYAITMHKVRLDLSSIIFIRVPESIVMKFWQKISKTQAGQD